MVPISRRSKKLPLVPRQRPTISGHPQDASNELSALYLNARDLRMTARIRYAVELLLSRFQQTWAESAAWRVMRGSPGEPADAVLDRCRAQAQQLFQPAFAEVQREDFQAIVAIEELLDRLEKIDRLPSDVTIKQVGSEMPEG